MDPQRQYAQLLTLWSEGSKLFRRDRHYNRRQQDEWDAWWRLGRRLVERGLMVLPVPFPEPILLVEDGARWFTLATASGVNSGVARGDTVVVTADGSSVLAWDNRWTVRMDLALRLGMRGWDTLMHWPDKWGTPGWTCDSLDAALTLLGALQRTPKPFQTMPMADWTLAARMMRHPERRFASGHALPWEHGFCYDAETAESWWERQDEDSVHTR